MKGFGGRIACLAYGIGAALLAAAPAWAGFGGPCGSGTAVVEPASLAVLAAGVGGLIAARRRNRRKD